MNRIIRKVAVLGSGVMGSRIACHFANIGVEVLLLDIVPNALLPEEESKKLTLDHPAVKNRIVNNALQAAIKSSPAPLYLPGFASLISTGNMNDDLSKIADADWVIEVVIERLDIKKQLLEKVEQLRKPGSIISSNTSGIPIKLMNEGRSEDFRKHFLGTHFFNPPRYLALLEIIPGPDTDPEVVQFLMDYGDRLLGKTTVLCKDTPAFIANRIGVFGIMSLFHSVDKMGLTVEEVDKLTGPVLGRPKSATFRTCDVVGLDTLVHVAKGLHQGMKQDEANALFEPPAWIESMVKNNWLGSKTGQGFFKKVKNADGSSEILVLDLKTLEYRPQQKAKFASLEATKQIDDLKKRLPMLLHGKDKAGEFYRANFFGLFSYVSHRIPEISDQVYPVDEAMRSGFGWDLGPFEYWDALGVKQVLDMMEAEGYKPAPWVKDMISKGITSFYRFQHGQKQCYNPSSGAYELVSSTASFILLDSLRADKVVWQNAGATVTHTGDGILNLEFHTKMNTIGSEVVQGLNKAIELAETGYRGLVVSNEGANFSAGANLGLIFMLAVEQEWDELSFAIRAFQQAVMRVRYSAVPVVVAPHNLTLGGSCEMSMHADHVQASAELYMGLVEFGAGVIPGGGGTKEFALRISDSFFEGDIELATLRNHFLTIGTAKVSTSAREAFELGFLKKGRDRITMNRWRLLADARAACLSLAEKGYTQPVQRNNIKVLGRQGLGIIHLGAASMQAGSYISEHDRKISEKLGWVLCGGDLSSPSLVSEQYLLDLEREAFLSLCGERKTLERMKSILTGGKALRN
ncbi:MAG: 3-hydroxyacyl-CoA dehydrogenase NAD-binding domain-containing protein [Bacteroidota bacterium]|jgi:3-hydroxyacyl-CoA dehydrogenase